MIKKESWREIEARMVPEMGKQLSERGLRLGAPVYVRAFKEERILEMFVYRADHKRFILFKRYPIAAASGLLGPKLKEGDKQVPEGFYSVSRSAMNPNSKYHLAFNIGYPNAYDCAHGCTGAFIMVHGGQKSIGCLAMIDPAIEEIYSLCDAQP